MSFLNLQITPDIPAVSMTSEAKQLAVLVELFPGEQRPTVSIRSNIALVLDRSPSMNGQKFRDTIKAAQHAVTLLRPEDILSVIGFDNGAHVEVRADRVSNVERTQAQIARLRIGSGTHISAGMETGRRELRRHSGDECVHRMFLLTDGETLGDQEKCRQLAREFADQQPPITLTTIGLGYDYKEDLLTKLADLTNGNFYHLARPDQIQQIFTDEVGSAQQVIALSPILHFRLMDGVKIRRVVRCRPDIVALPTIDSAQGRGEIRLPDLGENGLALLFELDLPSRQATGKFQIGRWEVATGDSQPIITGNVVVEYLPGGVALPSPNPHVMPVVDQIFLALAPQRAEEMVKAGNRAGATRLLQTVGTRLMADNPELSTQMLAAAEDLARQGVVSGETRKALVSGTRRLQIPQFPST